MRQNASQNTLKSQNFPGEHVPGLPYVRQLLCSRWGCDKHPQTFKLTTALICIFVLTGVDSFMIPLACIIETMKNTIISMLHKIYRLQILKCVVVHSYWWVDVVNMCTHSAT